MPRKQNFLFYLRKKVDFFFTVITITYYWIFCFSPHIFAVSHAHVLGASGMTMMCQHSRPGSLRRELTTRRSPKWQTQELWSFSRQLCGYHTGTNIGFYERQDMYWQIYIYIYYKVIYTYFVFWQNLKDAMIKEIMKHTCHYYHNYIVSHLAQVIGFAIVSLYLISQGTAMV